MDDEPVWFLTHEFTPFRGGAATYVREAAAAARRLGVDARVLAPDYRGRCSRELDDGGNLVARFPGHGKLGPLGIAQVAAGIWRHRRTLATSPLVAGSAGALMALILLDRAGLFRPHRLLCFLHGSEILKLRRRRFWRALAPGFFRRWPHFAVASHHVRELWWAELSPDAPDTVHLAPCACSEAFLDQARVAAAAASRPDVAANGELNVLTLARLHPRKGQVHVAHALGRLPDALRERVRYVVVGSGSESYRQEIVSACAASGVRLQGPLAVSDQDLAAVYAGATIYAQASVSLPESVEGFGITYLEAAACGLPVAAWASGGTAEAVLDGRTGLLAPEGDVAALTVALQRLLEDADLRVRLGQAGQAHARNFRWTDSARTLVGAARSAFPAD